MANSKAKRKARGVDLYFKALRLQVRIWNNARVSRSDKKRMITDLARMRNDLLYMAHDEVEAEYKERLIHG